MDTPKFEIKTGDSEVEIVEINTGRRVNDPVLENQFRDVVNNAIESAGGRVVSVEGDGEDAQVIDLSFYRNNKLRESD